MSDRFKGLSPELLLHQARVLARKAEERGAQPRVHPNGFIQLDLEEPAAENWHEGKQAGHSGADLRLHIWNPPDLEMPHQDTVNEVHDHVFDMNSTIVRGLLIQRLYVMHIGMPGGSHEIYRAVYDKTSSSRLEPLGIRGTLREWDAYTLAPGESYTQPAFTLHDSSAKDLVVTLMEKEQIHDGIPTVVCPINQPPDNDFDRATAAPQDELWKAIARSLA